MLSALAAVGGLGDLLRGTVFVFVANLISSLSEARRRAEVHAESQAEAIGKDISEAFRIIDADTQQPLASPVIGVAHR